MNREFYTGCVPANGMNLEEWLLAYWISHEPGRFVPPLCLLDVPAIRTLALWQGLVKKKQGVKFMRRRLAEMGLKSARHSLIKDFREVPGGVWVVPGDN